jgi:hypothetical protein
MNGGVKFLSCSALLIVAACGGEAGKLEVRAMPTPLAQGKKPVPFRVAEANAQMALGNVALALEAYRKAIREDPASIDALAGVAACYDRMGRFDLSRRHYEAALALEPHNPTILAMLAASLDQQGRSSEAALVRNEIQQRAAMPAPAADPATVAVAAVAAPPAVAGGPVASPPPAAIAELALPKPQATPLPALAAPPLAANRGAIAPIAVVAAFAPNDEPKPAAAARVAKPQTVSAASMAVAELALPMPQSVPLPVLAAAPLAAGLAALAPIAVVAAFAPDDEPKAAAPPEPGALAEATAPARSVTITLPAPRPVAVPAAAKVAETAPAAPAMPAPAPQQVPVALAYATPPVEAVRPPARQAIAAGPAPKLERLSLGEVALVTPGAPRWASLVVIQAQRSATVRFVPLKQSNVRMASVRLLNAARVQGLAARARNSLLDRGWRGIAIGDANAARAQSLVLYPAHRRATALSLARQFGFKTAQRASGREITVLLGRDAAALARRSPTA